MIRATRNWFRRNRTNFAIGFGVLGVGYVASQYVFLRRRFEQNQEDCTFTVLGLLPTATENILEALRVENITHELQQKKAEHLATTADIASSEMSSGPPSVTDDDGRSLQSFQSEGYIHASQNLAEAVVSGVSEVKQPGQLVPQQRTRKSKAKLWNELKISSITRAFTLLYTLSLLTLFTRIQLNLLGRRNYLSSVVSLASHPNESTINLENHDDDNLEQAYGNDIETNRRYLTFSWWLLHRGWKDVMTRVEAAVKGVFGPLSPREDITLEKLIELVLEVREKIEGSKETERRTSKWLPYLLPPREQEDYVLHESGMSSSTMPPTTTTDSSHMPLRKLLDETSDLIDSPPFTYVLTKLLDAGFSVLVDEKLRFQAYKLPPDPSLGGSRIQEISGDEIEAKAKVANILAVLTRQAHSIGLGTNAEEKVNEYLRAMEQQRDLEGFAAIVYSSNFEFEAPTTSSAGGKHNGRDGTGSKPEVPTASGTIECGESFADMSLVEAEFESAWGKATEHSG
ncbi:hypothetical protein FGG08_004687 [Glutinoglossum americanum]|uniref:Peroxin-3 n=1 Tax=Glutinoglossum americanum TaxID=1670608 RepID=A0A9P8IAV9_9PEZI|nr:hypothetical protein FGG08_004687 [Glutinoglossum americanum]